MRWSELDLLDLEKRKLKEKKIKKLISVFRDPKVSFKTRLLWEVNSKKTRGI